jgi:deazaflavin-dependent oxidoreductase (nitroreductase family)
VSTHLAGDRRAGTPRASPHWLIRLVGIVHLAGYRLTGGRLGLSSPTHARWGHMCLTTTGRRTGKQRRAMLGYFGDGPNLVALAVNAWADAEPAWWLNLQANPDAVVDLGGGHRAVRARAAEGEERTRLWARWRELGERSGEAMIANCDAYATGLKREPAVVVLEPREVSGDGDRLAVGSTLPTPPMQPTR